MTKLRLYLALAIVGLTAATAAAQFWRGLLRSARPTPAVTTYGLRSYSFHGAHRLPAAIMRGSGTTPFVVSVSSHGLTPQVEALANASARRFTAFHTLDAELNTLRVTAAQREVGHLRTTPLAEPVGVKLDRETGRAFEAVKVAPRRLAGHAELRGQLAASQPVRAELVGSLPPAARALVADAERLALLTAFLKTPKGIAVDFDELEKALIAFANHATDAEVLRQLRVAVAAKALGAGHPAVARRVLPADVPSVDLPKPLRDLRRGDSLGDAALPPPLRASKAMVPEAPPGAAAVPDEAVTAGLPKVEAAVEEAESTVRAKAVAAVDGATEREWHAFSHHLRHLSMRVRAEREQSREEWRTVLQPYTESSAGDDAPARVEKPNRPTTPAEQVLVAVMRARDLPEEAIVEQLKSQK